jgi:hypothetical protein
MSDLLLAYTPVLLTNPSRALWNRLGGSMGVLGPEVQGGTCKDGVSRYTHFERGSIYWHPESGAREIVGLSVRYGTESSSLSIGEMRIVVECLSLAGGQLKKPGTWEKLLDSDPIGQDPGEPPNWVGKEGWQIIEKFTELLRHRYEQRYENQPPGPDLPPSPLPAEPGSGRERGDSFQSMDRGNYEAERFDRIVRTA